MYARARWAAAAAVVVAGGAGIAAWAASGSATALAATTTKQAPLACEKDASTVTVQGTGTSSATPDQMTLTVDVHTQSATASAALANNARKAAALIAGVEHRGVPSRQIQTSGLNLQPTYDNSGNVTGYQVDDTITVTVNSLSGAGGIIDATVAATGNSARIEGVSFSVQHDGVVMALARASAVRQAANLAAQMAAADGLALGPVCSLHDNTAAVTPSPQPQFMYSATATPASTPVQPGTEQFQAQVTATYELVR